ncbi:MauE/DoxX family redox-associated membrane protein [Erythrobacter tepidarius]|uniref:MauE/DoxX family redox-associated membrane protein n=1 Tax=Erythrobacter tepidarius TaxID=60454 RepID=UPI000A391A1F|nr:MauE/DoxX family redox-associated membrane protein [Erythrobacter tepidarius]
MAALALFLALVLLGAAVHKALQRERLTHAVARLLGLPAPLAVLVLVLVTVLEGLAALALLIPATLAAGAAGAAMIWALYAVALLRRRGAVLDCGCDFQRREKPVGWLTILRPAVLAALAATCAWVPPAGWTIETPFAASALLALWLAASELAALPAFEQPDRRARS